MKEMLPGLLFFVEMEISLILKVILSLKPPQPSRQKAGCTSLSPCPWCEWLWVRDCVFPEPSGLRGEVG